MSNVAYIVLHYQEYDETIECVESILKNHGCGSCNIVIVDNASPNASGEKLRQHYINENNIHVLLNKNNEGFARGLNSGIDYCKTNFDIDFYVLLNNDTLIANSDWDNTINDLFDEYHFAVLGPDISSPDGKRHDNPTVKQDITVPGLKNAIKEKKKKELLYRIYALPIWLSVKNIIKKVIKWETPIWHSNFYEEEQLNVQLQGSCIILSRVYLNKYDGLFSKTYLYFEEAILRHRCEISDLLCMYSPKLKLIHKGSVSVKRSINSEREWWIFYLKNSRESCEAYLSHYEE